MKKALVVFSGGQDSSTCLFEALLNYDLVYTIGFEYGQRHQVEMKCRLEVLEAIFKEYPNLKEKFGGDKVVDMSSFKDLTDSKLTHGHEKFSIDKKNNLPTSFVPGRNLIFLCYAASYAYTKECSDLITGVGQADYSGYPDCRENTMQALQSAINLGMESNLKIVTPLMHLSKAATFMHAYNLGGMKLVKIIVKYTHTCYEGEHQILHEWGYGCGQCPSCKLRMKGYEEFIAKIKSSLS